MLIGLHGRKRAGKDIVYERAVQLKGDVVQRASFADLLYLSAAAALGVTVEDLQAWKSDPTRFVAVGQHVDGLGFFPHRAQTVREYLQRYGTEAHRDIFGPDFWVERINLAHAGRIVMVTDVRFENEARAIRAAGGAVVKIVGPPEVENAGDGHITEARLPDELIDATLKNDVRDDSFRSLDREVDTLLRLHLGTPAHASGSWPRVTVEEVEPGDV